MAKPGPVVKDGRPLTLKGWVQKRSWEAVRWLETEGFEGQASEAVRPVESPQALGQAQESEPS